MLTLQQLRQITHGALRVWEEDGAFCFSRFTPARAGNYPNIHVIDCSGFVPAAPEYFYDAATHPNDAGFACCGKNLIQTAARLLTPSGSIG